MSFPTTGILDNANRANEGPPPSANWVSNVDGGTGGLVVTGNVFGLSGTAKSAYWSAATFGPDSEVYATVAQLPDFFNQMAYHLRLQTPGSSAVDGYNAIFARDDANSRIQVFINRRDNDSDTQLGATINSSGVMAVAEKQGADVNGATVAAYRDTGSGFAQLATRTDATYSGAGNIAMEIDGQSTGQLDDFGGGTVVTGGAVAAQAAFQ